MRRDGLVFLVGILGVFLPTVRMPPAGGSPTADGSQKAFPTGFKWCHCSGFTLRVLPEGYRLRRSGRRIKEDPGANRGTNQGRAQATPL